MRVLILTPSLPYPPHQGASIRNFGIIHGLRHAGHDVTLLSFHENGLAIDSTPLATLCARVETVPPPSRPPTSRLRDLLLSSQPDLARRLDSPAFRERLQTLLNETRFDLVQFEGLEMAIYLAQAHAAQPEAKLCYDAHNAEYALQSVIFDVDRRTPSRWLAAVYSLVQMRRIAHFEREICQSVDCVIAVSDEDAGSLRPFRPDGRIGVVPNGIFASDYEDDRQRLDLGEHVLMFTGKMDYRPNVDAIRWFASAILPQVRRQVPDARLYIVGQKPHRSVQALRDQEHVEITGWVADVKPFLHAADVYVAPLRMGSGTRLKILEAMAAGCAVVATPIAASGLQPETREALLIAEGETTLTTAIVGLLQDPARRQALGEAARAVVRQHYDWSALIPCLLNIYKDAGIG